MIQVHGHRGCRGLYPENTIPAFEFALQLGVDALEMDVVISRDDKVIVSHEPYFNKDICTTPSGDEISPEQENEFNFYQMTFEEIIAFECGMKKHPRFPEQRNISARKPLLSEVIKFSEQYCLLYSRPLPIYNIEAKSTEKGDYIYHPEPDKFSELLMQILAESNVTDRCIIQSFDLRILSYIKKKYPSIKISLLAESFQSYDSLIQAVGFYPDFYSPHFNMIDEKLIHLLQNTHVDLLPWTVNEMEDMKKVILFNPSGIITDYPDRLLSLLAST